jgi:hypothetical protein
VNIEIKLIIVMLRVVVEYTLKKYKENEHLIYKHKYPSLSPIGIGFWCFSPGPDMCVYIYSLIGLKTTIRHLFLDKVFLQIEFEKFSLT